MAPGSHAARVLVGTHGGRVSWLALADERQLDDPEALLRAVKRVG
jgi:hypothetical protein